MIHEEITVQELAASDHNSLIGHIPCNSHFSIQLKAVSMSFTCIQHSDLIANGNLILNSN